MYYTPIDSHVGSAESMSASSPLDIGHENVTAACNYTTLSDRDSHPVSKLIQDARIAFQMVISEETNTLNGAAIAYRKRRGRHPPPGFDRWFRFAKEHDAVIVEEFFDQIYQDLQPFWGLDPDFIRRSTASYGMIISIRDGVASSTSDWFWTVRWLDLIKTIEHHLPDMDIPVNKLDEPRLVTPWEEINDLVAKAARTVVMVTPSNVISDFGTLPAPEVDPRVNISWEHDTPYWLIVRCGCPPESLARTTPFQTSFSNPPTIDTSHAANHMYHGFVSNYTLSTDPCHQPDLQGLEGIFLHPLSTSTTKTMFPIFGGSKLSVNNEILLPSPMYWKGDGTRFSGGPGGEVSWESKADRAVWRGVASGGRNTADNWRGFQRHRLVAMNNATSLRDLQRTGNMPPNFALPEAQYRIQAQADQRLDKWVLEWANFGFTDLSCSEWRSDGSCPYSSPHFQKVESMTLSEQFAQFKYMPDVDGNSFSGRFLAFMRSTSLPIKATVWREWHDSRLMAWKHFVPMDNRFVDYYAIMEYFLGYEGRGGHDEEAKTIALEGKAWAEKVLRKEDMQIYVLRLLLEYGRILDDRRQHMGWVGDLERKSVP
ncbi:hypothetical protein QFC21_002192 [Naganishia friedmannii]|uniref:Uncharacterized protein n=1 Tax=Naganishia friedmannii TaxID=89922 RepID=A0ACC2VWN4_9TREE|nr:hypothetical protein QFC21_002192 [Naganishia friedmannii]